MTELISSFGFAPVQWAMIMFAAALIGANKTGLVSISLLAIPLMASVFGGKASVGVILPILIIADIIAVVSYRKNIRWRELLGLLPWTIAGIGIGLAVGQYVSDSVFKLLIAIIIIVALVLLLVKEFTGKEIKLKSRWYSTAVIGLLGGTATMIGNAAGPIIATYFLSIDLEKDEFVSTRAWFYWLVNLVKVPLHIFFWKTITIETFTVDLMMIPAIAAGGLLGLLLVKRIPEKPYRYFVFIATFVSVVFLII